MRQNKKEKKRKNGKNANGGYSTRQSGEIRNAAWAHEGNTPAQKGMIDNQWRDRRETDELLVN